MPYPGNMPSGQTYNGQQQQQQYHYPHGQSQHPQYAYSLQQQQQQQQQQQLQPNVHHQQQQPPQVQHSHLQTHHQAQPGSFAPSHHQASVNFMNASSNHHGSFPSLEGPFDARHHPQRQTGPPHHISQPPMQQQHAQFAPQPYAADIQHHQQTQQPAPGGYVGYQQHQPQHVQQPSPQFYHQTLQAMGQSPILPNQPIQSVPQPYLQQRPSQQQQQQHAPLTELSRPPSVQPRSQHSSQHNSQHNSPAISMARMPSQQMPSPALPKNSPAIPSKPSPALAKKKSPAVPSKHSPGIAKRSPAIPPKQSPASSAQASPALSTKTRPADTNALLVHIGEECLAKAQAALPGIVSTLSDAQVKEYQKLVSTGLACLEAAIHSKKLSARQEAKARLRYASILDEETENIQEVETTLFTGIKLCEQHRYHDLKYCMQYVSSKVFFQRHPKAALKALDKQIADCQTFKHIPWVYSFRLLKATLYTYAGTAPDVSLIENFQSLSSLAHDNGDHALGVLASLLEGLAHLRVMKTDTIERVQTCLAQAAKYQMEASTQLPQLDVLSLLLDLACSMQQKTPDVLVQKLNALQVRMDATINSKEWSNGTTLMRIPIKKQHSSASCISDATTSILQPGSASEGQDYLALTFLTKVEMFLLVYTFSGLASMYRSGSAQSKGQRKSSDYWAEGLDIVQSWSQKMGGDSDAVSTSLQESVRQTKWRTEVFCYLQLLTGLYSATQSRWGAVDKCVAKLQKAASADVDEICGLFALYLAGVYHQGTGDLETALLLYEDPRLNLDANLCESVGGRKPAKMEISILSALNRLWILQSPAYMDEMTSTALLEQLGPICTGHQDLEIRAAFDLVRATVKTNPPASIVTVKQSISSALSHSQKTSNVHCLSIALNVMRSQLFENVVGEQALKSAKAASAQARRSGNLLWMSVADGMLAQSQEAQGQFLVATATEEAATKYANHAFQGKE